MSDSPINAMQPPKEPQPQPTPTEQPAPPAPAKEATATTATHGKPSIDPATIYPTKPAAPPVSEHPGPDPLTVYPTPGSQVDASDKDDNMRYGGVPPISAAVLSALLLTYGIYAIFTLIKALTASAAYGLYGVDLSFFGSPYAWISVLINIGLIITVFASSLGIWRRSKVALAFVAGLSFFIARLIVFYVIIIFDLLGELDFQQIMISIAYVAFIVSQVVCWTKDRKYFY